MPQRKAAQKALRQSQKKRTRNLRVKKEIKSALKDFRKTLNEEGSENKEKNLCKVYKVLDKAASKKIIHPNKAARKKSRLARRLKKQKTDNKQAG